MKRRLVSAIFDEYYPFLGYTELFGSYQATKNPNTLKENDVLVIWGGGDISPSLYGHKRHRYGGGYPLPGARDATEWALLQRAKELHIPIIGVCRGAQMLCASEGGHLIQDVDNHATGSWHEVVWSDGELTSVNSLHHQMMVPKGNFELVAKPPRPLGSTYHVMTNDGEETTLTTHDEPEFLFYPDVLGFAVQWHPEMMWENDPATEKMMQFIQEKLA